LVSGAGRGNAFGESVIGSLAVRASDLLLSAGTASFFSTDAQPTNNNIAANNAL
jgi:hypothetical protein